MGSNVIFFNENRELLLVKPNYKSYWLLPGGSADANESPRQTAIRETKEEIGLNIDAMQLLVVDYFTPPEGNNLKFMFYGGTLSVEQVASIVLQEEELDEFVFVPIEKALEMLGESMKKRIPHCLEALRNNDALYLENGEKI